MEKYNPLFAQKLKDSEQYDEPIVYRANEAQNLLGDIEKLEKKIEEIGKNANSMIQYYQYCLQHDSIFSRLELGNIWRELARNYHFIGDTLSEENAYQNALRVLTELASSDSGEADDLLGQIYDDGGTSVFNIESAFLHYEKSAIKGYPQGVYHLACAYEYGKGVRADKHKAFQLLTRLIGEGDGLYHLFLGVYYDYGIGVARNAKKAVEIYKYYAENGAQSEEIRRTANYLLGVCYYHGHGVACDHMYALKLFESSKALTQTSATSKYYINAIIEGDYLSCYALSRMYAAGIDSLLKEDQKRSFGFCEQAYQRSDGKLFHSELARKYFYGRGTKLNFNEALKLYSKAGTSEALQIQGECYYYGCTVPKDGLAAMRLFIQNAENQNDRYFSMRSTVYLGLCYLTGVGIRKNTDEALRYFDKVAGTTSAFEIYALAFSALIRLSYVEYENEKEKGLEQLQRVSQPVGKYSSSLVEDFFKIYQHRPTKCMANRLIGVLQQKLSIQYQRHRTAKKLEILLSFFRYYIPAVIKDSSFSNSRTFSLTDFLRLYHELEKTMSTLESKEELLLEKEKRIVQQQEEISFYRDNIQVTLEGIDDKLVNLENLLISLQTQITQGKADLQKQILAATDEAAVEKLYMDFFRRFSEDINKELLSKGGPLVDTEEALLKGLFGNDHWEQLDEYTRKSLISARVFLMNCNTESYSGLDYSGVVIAATSALENELKLRFFDGYKAYLRENFGTNFNRWPKSMKFGKPTGYYEESDRFSIGALPVIFGSRTKDVKGGQTSRKEKHRLAGQEKASLKAYLETILVNPDGDWYRILYGEKNEQGEMSKPGYLDRCEDVRCGYRNAAAHTEHLSKATAEKCCDAIIGQQDAANKVGQIQGMIMELVQLFKLPEIHT